jgi:TPR repeat protein
MTSQIIAIGLAVALFVGSMTACRPRIGSRTPSPTRAVPAHVVDYYGDYSAGLEAYRRRDYATALLIFRQFADLGDADAQVYIGVMYEKGKGVPQDYASAMKWFRKAADQGYASAQYIVGDMYDKGLGVTEDYAAALKWFRKAANQSYAPAQTNLGFMYSIGQGVTLDLVQAHMWYNLSAAKGNKIAEEVRDLLAETMTPAQIAKAQRLAREWKPKGK